MESGPTKLQTLIKTMQENNWTIQLNDKKNGYYVSPIPGLNSKAIGQNHIHVFLKDDGKLIAHHTYGNKELHIDDSDLTVESLGRIYYEGREKANWHKYKPKSKSFHGTSRVYNRKSNNKSVKRKSKYRSVRK